MTRNLALHRSADRHFGEGLSACVLDKRIMIHVIIRGSEMRFRLAGFAVLLMVTLSTLLALISAGSESFAPAELLAFASADCTAPCWQGIEVGNTTATEALTLRMWNPALCTRQWHMAVDSSTGSWATVR
jgi:hypothetical protein